MAKKKKKYILIGLIALLFLGGIFNFLNKQKEKAEAGLGDSVQNIIGTRVGTTTTGGGFYGSHATNGTTSVRTQINSYMDEAIYTFRITAASSTPSGLFSYEIFGSNDNSCTTATTSTTAADTVITKDINWYSLGAANRGLITATGGTATGTILAIQNLTWKCLKFEANGSSSEALIQLITKDKQ